MLLWSERIDLAAPVSELARRNFLVDFKRNVIDHATRLAAYCLAVVDEIFRAERLDRERHVHDLCRVSVAGCKVHKAAFCDDIYLVAVLEGMLNRFTVDELFHERVIEEETCRMMLEEIYRLPGQMQEIMLRALEGKQNKEIASDLGISVETVHSLKKIAYRKLRESMKDEYYILLLLLILNNTL